MFYDFPAENWIYLRTSNPIESTFAKVRLDFLSGLDLSLQNCFGCSAHLCGK